MSAAHTPNYRKRIELVEAIRLTPEFIVSVVLDDKQLPACVGCVASSFHRERREVYSVDLMVAGERVILRHYDNSDNWGWITVDADGRAAYWPADIFGRLFEPLKAGAPTALAALEEALEFVADQEDVVDGSDGRPQANRAMRVAQTLRAAIAAATGSAA